jgi:DNA-binding NtrC family response regulator
MLAGCRVLVVENEALVAEAISEVLIEAEGAPVGLARSACEARQLIKNSLSLDAALLDGNLSEGPVIPVLEALNAPGVPTGVYTGGVVSENFRHRNVDLITLAKPVLPARLIGEIRNVIAGSHPHPSAE